MRLEVRCQDVSMWPQDWHNKTEATSLSDAQRNNSNFNIHIWLLRKGIMALSTMALWCQNPHTSDVSSTQVTKKSQVPGTSILPSTTSTSKQLLSTSIKYHISAHAHAIITFILQKTHPVKNKGHRTYNKNHLSVITVLSCAMKFCNSAFLSFLDKNS